MSMSQVLPLKRFHPIFLASLVTRLKPAVNEKDRALCFDHWQQSIESAFC